MLVLWLSACQPMQPLADSGVVLKGPSIQMSKDEKEQAALADQQIADADFAGAEQTLAALVEKRWSDADLFTKLGNVQRWQGKNDAAQASYDAALMSLPGSPDALEGKGLSLMEQLRFEEAAVVLEEVVRSSPNRWKSLNAIGVAFAARGQHAEAVQYYQAALKVAPENALVLNNIGLSFASQKQFAEAVRALKGAAIGFANDAERRRQAELNLSLVYGLGGMLEPSEMLLRRNLPPEKAEHNLMTYAKLRRNPNFAQDFIIQALTKGTDVYENMAIEKPPVLLPVSVKPPADTDEPVLTKPKKSRPHKWEK